MKRETELYQMQDMIRQISHLNDKCENNMRLLNDMMLELRGIIAMVRPSARRNDWYGKEIEASPAQIERTELKPTVYVEYDSTN